MDKHRLRAHLDDGLFVVLIMAAAMASAVMEASAVLGAWKAETRQLASTGRAASAQPTVAAAAPSSSVDGAVVSVAAPRAAAADER